MTEIDLKRLNKDVSKAKRIATEYASQIHDVVEDSLWTDYQRLFELSEKTVAACLAWEQAKERLEQAGS